MIYTNRFPSGFPNGRRLEDEVVDITLAVVLLDLSVHSVTDLVGLNPTANDRPFPVTFPYLATKHSLRFSNAVAP